MPGQRAHPAVELRRLLATGPFQRRGDPRRVLDRSRPRPVDGQPQPLPRRDRAQLLGSRLDPQPHWRIRLARRSGRALAEAPDHRLERAERLLPGHLLLDDRRHQRLHHQVGGAQPPVRVAAPRVGDRLVQRLEPRRVVVGAQHPRQPVEHPLRAVSPGLARDGAVRGVGLDAQGGRSLGGADAAPDHAVRRTTVGGVVRSAAMVREHQSHRARPVRSPHPGARDGRDPHGRPPVHVQSMSAAADTMIGMLLARLVEVSTAVAATRSRLEKRDLIADLLRETASAGGADEIDIAASYLSGTLRQRRTGVGWRGLSDTAPPADDAVRDAHRGRRARSRRSACCPGPGRQVPASRRSPTCSAG